MTLCYSNRFEDGTKNVFDEKDTKNILRYYDTKKHTAHAVKSRSLYAGVKKCIKASAHWFCQC